jgi:2-dehydropantoate 2-reductase
MRHAVLGAGGVGGLMGGMLAQFGEQVTLLLRPQTFPRHPDSLVLERQSGKTQVVIERATALNGPADVLWVAVKAPQLEAALRIVPQSGDGIGIIVPLLNGVDHVALLESRFGAQRVVAGTIAVESERVSPGHIIQRSPFARMALAEKGKPQLGEIAEKLRNAGFTCEFQSDVPKMMWGKLAFLAPLALTTTASERDTSGVFGDPEWKQRLVACAREACDVAAREGASLEHAKIVGLFEALPPHMRSSMQKDVAAGRTPELDAIAGPIVRCGAKHGIATPVTGALVAQIRNRVPELA